MTDKSFTLMNDEQLELLGEALSSPIRRKILSLITTRSYSALELAKATNVALSTMSFHLKILKSAGLIKMISSPDKRGNEKNISQACQNVYIAFSQMRNEQENIYTIELPIGSYCNFDITPPCIICSKYRPLDEFDNPGIFYSPNRHEAQLISFFKGFLEYRISTHPFKNKAIESITFSLELCSECPNYNNHWKSDITFWINDIELCTYRSPGDYGDRKGVLNPDWWPRSSTQYGMLKKIRVDEEGTWLDELLVSKVTVDKLNIPLLPYVSLKFGVKDTSKYVGGINIFGKSFGDHSQDILVQISMMD